MKTLGNETIVGNGEWQRISITTTEEDVAFDLRWAFVSLELEIFDYYIDAVQIEKKSYVTPFVDGIRNDIATDYSGNNNTANLSMTTTPRWMEENNNGYYSFNGTNQFMQSSYVSGIYNNELSFSSWIKPTSLNGAFEISNQNQWHGGPWTGWRFKVYYTNIYLKLGDNTNTTYACSGGNLKLNE